MKKSIFSLANVFMAMLAIIVIVTSCKQEKIKIKLDDPNEQELDSINEVVLTRDTSISLMPTPGAKGETWEAWEGIFESCFKNKTFRKNKVYLGPSNFKYLGTILSRDKNTTRRELAAYIPLSEFAKFTSVGQPVNNCDLSSVKDFSLDVMLGATISQMSDSMRLVLKNFDSTRITGGQWQIDELRVDDFLDYINESEDPKIQKYKKSLLENGNVLLTKVIKVNGFSAEVFSAKEIKGGVAASLTTGQTFNVVTGDSTNNNNDFKVKLDLSKSKKNVVNVSSSGQFYIFGMAQKGTKL